MAKMQYVIGLDIGTTSAKAVIFLKNGRVVAQKEQTYPVSHPRSGWAEQDPLLIEEAAIQAIHAAISAAQIDKKNILSVGLSTAMHSLICVDENWNPLSQSIVWADGRSTEYAEQLKNTETGTSIYLKTGTPIHPMSPLTKLIWLRNNEPDTFEKTARFVSIKEFLTGRWFGISAVDYSIASATGLFNIETLTWDKEALDLAGISSAQLSTPVGPTYLFEGLSPEIAKKTGLDEKTPFAAGGSDGPLANLGIGAINPGETAITIGTSGAIRQMSAKPKTDSKQQAFCYAFDKDHWIIGGPTNNGGIVLQWLKELLGEEIVRNAAEQGKDPSALLIQEAEGVPPGANGLLFLPFLNGERAPYWDSDARGSFIGLSINSNKKDMIRAGLEGVLFSLLNVSEALERLAGKTETLYASGGFARSPMWVQMLADIFGQDVHLPESHQSSAWGAAWCSLVALGEADSFQSIKSHIPMKGIVKTNMAVHENYQEVYKVYLGLYDSLKPSFDQLASFRNNF